MHKVMMIQPRDGKPEDLKRGMAWLRERGCEVQLAPPPVSPDEWDLMGEAGYVNRHLYDLSRIIETMSLCTGVYFCKGWRDDAFCHLVYACARDYRLKYICEDLLFMKWRLAQKTPRREGQEGED